MTLFGHSIGASELIVMSAGAGWTFSALSYAMPAPASDSGRVYQFVYRLVHFVAANLDRVGKGNHGPDPEV